MGSILRGINGNVSFTVIFLLFKNSSYFLSHLVFLGVLQIFRDWIYKYDFVVLFTITSLLYFSHCYRYFVFLNCILLIKRHVYDCKTLIMNPILCTRIPFSWPLTDAWCILDINYSIVNKFITSLVNVIFVTWKLITVSYYFSMPNSNMLLQLLYHTQFCVT